MAKNGNNVGRAHNVGQGETLDQFSGVAIIAPPPWVGRNKVIYRKWGRKKLFLLFSSKNQGRN